MNILLISCQPPLPANQGARVRLWALIRHLSLKHSVFFLGLSSENISQNDVLELEEFTQTCKLVVVKRDWLDKAKDLLLSAVLGTPYTVLANTHGPLRDSIARVVANEKIDLVQVEELYTAENVINQKLTCPIILDAHNVEGLILERLSGFEKRLFPALFNKWQTRIMRRYERRVARRFDALFAVSETEQRYFIEHGITCHLVSNGVDPVVTNDAASLEDPVTGARTDKREGAPSEQQAVTLLYCGSFDYFPNQDAVLYFAREILPLIAARNPTIRFRIVGRNPNRKVVALASPTVEILPNVKTVAPYFATSQILVVPLRAGGGTRLKILQAFAAGLPVVSSSIGAEGLNAADNVHLLVRDDALGFAEAIQNILDSPELATRLTTNAKTLAEEVYSWERIVAQCDEYYRQVRNTFSTGRSNER